MEGEKAATRSVDASGFSLFSTRDQAEDILLLIKACRAKCLNARKNYRADALERAYDEIAVALGYPRLRARR